MERKSINWRREPQCLNNLTSWRVWDGDKLNGGMEMKDSWWSSGDARHLLCWTWLWYCVSACKTSSGNILIVLCPQVLVTLTVSKREVDHGKQTDSSPPENVTRDLASNILCHDLKPKALWSAVEDWLHWTYNSEQSTINTLSDETWYWSLIRNLTSTKVIWRKLGEVRVLLFVQQRDLFSDGFRIRLPVSWSAFQCREGTKSSIANQHLFNPWV